MKQINYKLGNKTLIGSAILVIIFFLLCSCGARKVDKSKTETKETATLKDSSKTVTKLESNTKIVDISESDEIEIVPIDNTKEIVVNGKKYFNAKIRHVNKKSNIVVSKSINSSQIKQNDVKKAFNKTTSVEVKNTDRKQYDWTKTIIVISVILGVVFWLIYFFYFRKAKKVVD